MKSDLIRLLAAFARRGVLHREGVKNNRKSLQKLLQGGYVTKVYKKGRVFYELTEQALPIVDLQRKILLEEAGMLHLSDKRSHVYASLLGDLRFLDENRPEAAEFLFLGDWQLHRPVVPSQLELAKLRFYKQKGLI